MTAEELFLRHMKLVYLVSKKYSSSSKYEKSDINQVGMLGLWKAVLRFDKTKKCKFSTFAVTCIKNEINYFLRNQKKEQYCLFTDCDEYELEKLSYKECLEEKILVEEMLSTLTKKEREICKQVGNGFSCTKMASDRGITKEAMRKQKDKVFKKIKDQNGGMKE